MPFHSTTTEEEAQLLVVTFCRRSYGGDYRIARDWPEQDILAAMESAKRQFELV